MLYITGPLEQLFKENGDLPAREVRTETKMGTPSSKSDVLVILPPNIEAGG